MLIIVERYLEDGKCNRSEVELVIHLLTSDGGRELIVAVASWKPEKCQQQTTFRHPNRNQTSAVSSETRVLILVVACAWTGRGG